VQTQQLKQREDWRRRREKYLRESDRHVELIKEGYECGDSSKDWAVIVGRGERGVMDRHSLGARLFLVRTDVPTSTSGARGNMTGRWPDRRRRGLLQGRVALSRGEKSSEFRKI